MALWLVEIVLDTGQRYQSEDLDRTAAALMLDMLGRAMVVAASMVCLGTGEALCRPSRSLLASTRRLPFRDPADHARMALAEAFGA